MPDRLTPLDVSFLYLEEPSTAMHVGSVMLFRPAASGLDLAALTEHIQARVAPVPRYRQRVRTVPGRLANPVWVDDENFDIGAHIRRVQLPAPGSAAQLEDLVARVQARPLHRDRPLWEVVVVEGLDGGEFALITKVHQAMVDGVHAVDLGQVILDEDAHHREPPQYLWKPGPEPTTLELVAEAVAESVGRPTRVLETLTAGLGDIRATATKAAGALGGLGLAARTATRPVPRSPLNQEVGETRRFRMVVTDLEDYRTIRTTLAARATPGASRRRVQVSVNDVVLGVVAGALRSWLLGRGVPVPPSASVRALVPMSVKVAPDARAGAVGSRVSSLLIDLPTGEGNPLIRIAQVSYQTMAHREAGMALDAQTIAGLAGFAPATLHSLGARVASGLSRHIYNLVVTNVPGPQTPLYLDGAQLTGSFPVIPLARTQALSIGLTSYDGAVCYGLYADHDAVPDLDVLGASLQECLTETLEALRER